MKKLFNRIDLTAGCLFVFGAGCLLIGAVSKPAEVRAKDPKPVVVNVQSAELPNGIQRLTLDGHWYYWKAPGSFSDTYQPLLIHAAGCTNHVCPVSVQVETPIAQRISEPPKPSVPWVLNPTNTVVIGQQQEAKMVPGSSIVFRNPELGASDAIHVERDCDHEPATVQLSLGGGGIICGKCGKPIKAVYK